MLLPLGSPASIGGLTPLGVGRKRHSSYGDKVIAAAPANLLAYWKLDDLAGAQATDYSGNGRHGTYNGASLNAATFADGSPAPSFDGVNDCVDAGVLHGILNVNVGTITAFVRVANAGVWSDGVARSILSFGAGSLNTRINWQRLTADNLLRWRYADKFRNHATSTTDWFALAMRWDKTADQAVGFVDGVAAIGAHSGLGTVTLNSSYMTIGAENNSGSLSWHGSIAHVAIWDAALSDAQIASLAVVS